VLDDQVDYSSGWAQISNAQISIYQCPSDDTAGRALHFYWTAALYFSRSNYVTCWGSTTQHPFEIRTFQDGACATPGVCNHTTDGAFREGKAREFREFIDGTSQTVLISELIAGRLDDNSNSFDLRGAWAEPFMGPGSYTHLNTPNSSAPDSFGWCPSYNPVNLIDPLDEHRQAFAARTRPSQRRTQGPGPASREAIQSRFSCFRCLPRRRPESRFLISASSM
jgi:hypothetical protein